MSEEEVMDELKKIYDLLADKTDDETYDAWLIVEEMIRKITANGID